MVIPADFYTRLITALFLAGGFLVCYFFAPLLLSLAFIGALLVILLYEWPRIGIWWLTPLYPVLPFALLIALNHSPERRLILFICITCALFDTAGYLFGSLFGKHKLAPRLSPKKTWEGLVAGIASVLLMCPWFISTLHLTPQNTLFFYCFMIFFCILALSGDLLVSYFKRTAGLKDTSNLLPGHGGILDRLDSILLTTIFVYATKGYLV